MGRGIERKRTRRKGAKLRAPEGYEVKEVFGWSLARDLSNLLFLLTMRAVAR
jgi:hypothetical protein